MKENEEQLAKMSNERLMRNERRHQLEFEELTFVHFKAKRRRPTDEIFRPLRVDVVVVVVAGA